MDSDDNDIFQIDETAWLETITIGGFRVWHIIAFCLGILLSLIIMVCCCIRFRIPRTKQEIEADYQRKQITKKFREKLQQIKTSEMDDMDLQKVIARIQADFDFHSVQNSVENLTKEPQQNANVKFKHHIQIPA